MRRSDSARDDAGPAPSTIGAVVAAFHPGEDLVAAVASVVGQVDALVVVHDDDLADEATRAVLQRCVGLGAEVVQHGENRGIGAALNSGVAALGSALTPPRFVVTLDQDSVLADDYVETLVRTALAAESAGVRVGMVAPDRVGSMVRRPPRRRGKVWVGGEPIQSGLLVPASVLERLGGFDESLVIDGVDTDFYLRALDAGLTCVVARGTRIEHHLGTALPTPAGAHLPLQVATTFRYHYQWRNLVRLLRTHGRRHPVWAVSATLRAARHLAIVTVLAPGRAVRLGEAARGLRAGLRGEQGRRPD